MKKSHYSYVGIALLVVIIGVGYYLVTHENGAPQVASVEANKVEGATVSVLSAGVFVQASTTMSFDEIDTSATATVGSLVKTNSEGRALVQSSFSHPTALDYNSEIAIKDSDDQTKTTDISLLAGSMWARVEQIVAPGTSYQVETSNAVAVVRGTSFGVSYSGTSTVLMVAKGEVIIYDKNPDGSPALDSGVSVKAGQKGTVIGNAKPILAPLTAADEHSDWFSFNASADGIVLSSSTNTAIPASPSMAKPSQPAPAKTTSVVPANTAQPQSASPSVSVTSAAGATVAPTGGQMSGGGAPAGDTVSITSVSPKTIRYGDNNTFVVVSGSNFNRVQSLSVAEDVPPDTATIDNSTIEFHIGKLLPGSYDINLLLDDGTFVTLPGGLVITRS